ncbi:nuclear transport factor 2 family protein [Cellulomonas sp. P5_C5]
MRITTRHTLLAALTGAALLLGGCAVGTTPTQSPTVTTTPDDATARALAEQWAEAWNTQDDAALAALFTTSGTYQDHAFQTSFTGPDGVASWAQITHDGVADVHAAVDEIVATPDRAVVRWTFSGQLVGAPTPFAVPAVTYIEISDGKISALADYYNRADVLAQSGLPADTVFE